MRITRGSTDWDNESNDSKPTMTVSKPKTPVKYIDVSHHNHDPPVCDECGMVIPHSETHPMIRDNSVTDAVVFKKYHTGCNPMFNKH